MLCSACDASAELFFFFSHTHASHARHTRPPSPCEPTTVEFYVLPVRPSLVGVSFFCFDFALIFPTTSDASWQFSVLLCHARAASIVPLQLYRLQPPAATEPADLENPPQLQLPVQSSPGARHDNKKSTWKKSGCVGSRLPGSEPASASRLEPSQPDNRPQHNACTYPSVLFLIISQSAHSLHVARHPSVCIHQPATHHTRNTHHGG